MEAAGGIGDDQVGATGDGRIERVVDDRARIGAGRVGDHRHLGPVGPDAELVDGGGAERVRGGEQDGATLGRVAAGELADRRGLAGAVDADDEDDRRTARRPPSAGSRRDRAATSSAASSVRMAASGAGVAIPAGTLDEVDGEGGADVAGDQRLLDVVPGRSLAGRRCRAGRGGAP